MCGLGGVGRCVAQWIVKGAPDDDVSGVRVDRFKPFQSGLRYRSERAPEALGETHSAYTYFSTVF